MLWFFGGMALGLILTSMCLSIQELPANIDRIALMDALGSFVGGHLQALGLLAVAIGLYFQSRQLREARLTQTDEQRWRYFEMIREDHVKMCEDLKAVVFHEDSTNREPRPETLPGTYGVVQALNRFSWGDGELIALDWHPLERYVEQIARLQKLAREIRDPDRREMALAAAEADPDNHKAIADAISWRKAKRMSTLKRAEAAGLSEDACRTLHRLLEVVHMVESTSVQMTTWIVRALPCDGCAPVPGLGNSEKEAYLQLLSHFDLVTGRIVP